MTRPPHTTGRSQHPQPGYARERETATDPVAQPAHIHEVLQAVRRHCARHPGLEPPELERLADLLLRVFGPDPDYPIRAELEHRTMELHSIDDPHDPVARAARRRAAPPEDNPPSLQALIARLLVAGNLRSTRQREVARLYLWGYSLPEIAELLGIPVSTVRARWRGARAQLQRALTEFAGDGLTATARPRDISSEDAAAAFRDQQHIPRYAPPRHCPPGRERCARTGVCAMGRR